MASRLSWSCPFNCRVVKDERESLIDHFAEKHRRAMAKLIAEGEARAEAKRGRAKNKAGKEKRPLRRVIGSTQRLV